MSKNAKLRLAKILLKQNEEEIKTLDKKCAELIQRVANSKCLDDMIRDLKLSEALEINESVEGQIDYLIETYGPKQAFSLIEKVLGD